MRAQFLTIKIMKRTPLSEKAILHPSRKFENSKESFFILCDLKWMLEANEDVDALAEHPAVGGQCEVRHYRVEHPAPGGRTLVIYQF